MSTDAVVVENKTDSIFRIPRLTGPRVFANYKKTVILSYSQLE